MKHFGNTFNEELLKEIPVITLGIFPGKFKLPHRGHFKTAEAAARENKAVIVLISEKEHEGFSADQALMIWEIYNRHLPNVEPYVITLTPMIGCYELMNILNNQDFVPTKTSSQPKTNIMSVVESSPTIQTYLNKGNNFKLNLYSSPEDSERFRNAQKEPYTGKNVLGIDFRPVDRLTSATAFRQAIATRNVSEVEKFLPPVLSKEEKKEVINIIYNATV